MPTIKYSFLPKVLRVLGWIFLVIAAVSFFVLTFIVVGDGSNTYDLMGLIIPQASMWTSYVPYVGWVVAIFFELLSLHGLAVISLSILFSYLGYSLIRYSEHLSSNTRKELPERKALSSEGRKELEVFLRKTGQIQD